MTMNKSFVGKKILLTGHKGFIGKELLYYFQKNNCEVYTSNTDLSLKKNWQKIINKKVDLIYHLAAAEGIGKDISFNSKSILYLLETCVEKKCSPKIIYASTTNIFGLKSKSNITECANDTPLSEFSSHKLLAENYLRFYYLKYNIKSLALRIPNIYGPVNDKNNFKKVVLNKIILKAVKTKKIALFKNKDSLRDFIFIVDVVKAFYLSGKLQDKYFKGNYFIISSNEKKTLKNIFFLIKKNIPNVMLHEERSQLSPMEYRNNNFNSKLFRRISGWKNEFNIEQGILLTLESINDF